VEVYRELSPEIVNFWYDLENAVMAVIRDQEPRKVRGLLIDVRAPFLRIRLPSGRRLHYCRPKIQTRRVRCGTDEKTGEPKYFMATNMTYEGMNQTTKRWEREATHGGKLTENVVQAIALDLLNNGLTEAEKEGFNVVLHVHDEIGAEEELGDAARAVDKLIEAISRCPEWAADLPLDAAGYESPWYKKD
jgi:DNA polymerase